MRRQKNDVESVFDKNYEVEGQMDIYQLLDTFSNIENHANLEKKEKESAKKQEETRNTHRKETSEEMFLDQKVYIIQCGTVIPCKKLEEHGFREADKHVVTVSCRLGKLFVPRMAVYDTEKDAEKALEFYCGKM